MSRNSFVEGFSKLPLSGKNGCVRQWYLLGREAALNGNEGRRNRFSIALGATALFHGTSAAFGVKFGIDNLQKDTTVGNVAAGYDSLFVAGTASAAYVQLYLASKLQSIKSDTTQPQSTTPDLTLTQREFTNTGWLTPPSEKLGAVAAGLARDLAVTGGAQILFALSISA